MRKDPSLERSPFVTFFHQSPLHYHVQSYQEGCFKFDESGRTEYSSLVFALRDTDRAGGGHYLKYFATEYLEIVLEKYEYVKEYSSLVFALRATNRGR